MYGDDLRIQTFADELDDFKEEMYQLEDEDDLVELIDRLLKAGVSLLNDVCSLQKRIVN